MNRFTRPLLYLIISMLFIGSTPLAAEESVNVYSYRQPFLIEPMFEAFTAETGISVNTVFAKNGLIERLKNEGTNSPADILITVDIGRLSGAVKAGITQAVDSSVLTENIPAEFRDPGNHWFSLSNRARIIVTSKDRVTDNEVSSYEDLANPALKGRVCTRSGKHEYMVALIASIIAHHGADAARNWLTGVKANLARKPQGNDRAQVKAIKEGQCDVAIINSYYMGAMTNNPDQVAWADAVNVIFPNQDSRGTHMNSSGMSLTIAAPHRENAIRLMEFLSGPIAQKKYAEDNYEYPVNPDIPWSDLVMSWGQFKHDTLPLTEIAALRTNAAKLVDEVGYDF